MNLGRWRSGPPVGSSLQTLTHVGAKFLDWHRSGKVLVQDQLRLGLEPLHEAMRFELGDHLITPEQSHLMFALSLLVWRGRAVLDQP